MQTFKLKILLILFFIAILLAGFFTFRYSLRDPGFKRQVLILPFFHPRFISDSVYRRMQPIHPLQNK
jgi:hypothetical protein